MMCLNIMVAFILEYLISQWTNENFEKDNDDYSEIKKLNSIQNLKTSSNSIAINRIDESIDEEKLLEFKNSQMNDKNNPILFLSKNNIK